MKRLVTIIFALATFAASAFAGQKDTRVREYLSPTRIVWMENSKLISNADFLLREGNGQADLANMYISVFKSTKDERPSILLDFGKELQGGIQIVTGMPGNQKPVNVRIRFGESVSEAMCEIDGKNGATNDHAVRDFTTTLPWLGVREIGNSGFRFARIDFLDYDREVHIKEIRAISTYRDVPYRGSFKCNDERLNKIWETGAYTVHLNMQDYLWDGVKRDRLVWMGDLHPEIMAVNYVFGHNEVVPKSVDLVRDTTPLPAWMNGISTYAIWWILIQHDWYLFHGDLEYLKQQKDYLKGLLEILHGYVGEDGVETFGGGFLDWPSNANNAATRAGVQSLMVMAMKAGHKLCNLLGESELAKTCLDDYNKMMAASDKVCARYFEDAKDPTAPGGKQGAALLSIAGIMDPQLANEKVLSVEGSRGFSTFYGYYMLQAMAKAGDYDGAMNIIKEFWGAMLDMGATTFWEVFHIDWLPDAAPIDELVPEGKKDIHGDFGAYCYVGFRHSLCHGWASGPTSWLSEHVLGVTILEPGCKKVKIEPHLGNLEWAEGSFPTPYGDIQISHKKSENGKIITKVKAPKGVKIVK